MVSYGYCLIVELVFKQRLTKLKLLVLGPGFIEKPKGSV